MTTRRTALHGLAVGALSLAAGPVLPQDDKTPISLLVGANGSMDFAARVIADQLRESLGRTVVVLSKLGAGQRLALGEARRAAPDGRTLVFATSGPFAIYPHIYKKLDYDPVSDFTPIAGVSSFDVAIATGPETGAVNLGQLVEWVRSHGGSAAYGTPGNGSLSHFVGIAMGLATNLKMTHVAYKDVSIGVVDLVGGRVPIMISGLNSFVEMHKAGKLRIVAVSGEARSPLVPEIPTLKEGGVNVSSATSTGVFGPRGMSPELVKRLQDAIAPIWSSAAIKDKLAGQSMVVWPATAQQLAVSLAEERKRFEHLVQASGYVLQDA